MILQSRSGFAILAFAAVFALLPVARGANADWWEPDLAAAAALRDKALSGTRAFEHVSSLVTEVGPRSAGSAGDAAAVRWAMNRLGALGFSHVHTQDVLVPHWVRGTALSALPPASVKGKIVFIDERMQRTRDGSGYAATMRNRGQGPSVAADLGAVALVIRPVGTSDDRIAHTGGLRYREDAPRIPAFALSNPDADLLACQLQPGKPVRMRVKSTARELPPAWSANVVGEIPGRERPQEIVLLAAHLDSWDLGHGAIDDGAGVAIVTEAARLIGKLDRPPARTIRVVLFANEEFGTSGGREYARLAGEEISRHVLALEADFGAGPVWRLESRVATESLPSLATMLAVLAPLDIAGGSNSGQPGSDVHPLMDVGVPILDLTLDGTKYFDVHHTVNDTLSNVDARTLDQSVAAFAVAAYLAATKQGDFGRAAVEPAVK